MDMQSPPGDGLLTERLGHLVEDGVSRFGGVRRLGDGASDDQVAGSHAQSVCRGGDSLLVSNGGASRPNPRNDQDSVRPSQSPQPRNFLRRANKTAYPGFQT